MILSNLLKLFIFVTLLFFITPNAIAKNLEIHHINVGQGDSTLVVGPNGTSILIDAGDAGYFGRKDGGKIVFEYLESINVNHLDFIIVTHRDSDHVGGFAFSAYPTSMHSLLLAERVANENIM